MPLRCHRNGTPTREFPRKMQYDERRQQLYDDWSSVEDGGARSGRLSHFEQSPEYFDRSESRCRLHLAYLNAHGQATTVGVRASLFSCGSPARSFSSNDLVGLDSSAVDASVYTKSWHRHHHRSLASVAALEADWGETTRLQARQMQTQSEQAKCTAFARSYDAFGGLVGTATSRFLPPRNALESSARVSTHTDKMKPSRNIQN